MTPQKFLDRTVPEPYSGCWIWCGAVNSVGYGNFQLENKNLKAHRESYRMFVGEIRAGLSVLHKCDTKMCVNPNHLFLGTQKDNVLDASKKHRLVGGQRGKLNSNLARLIRLNKQRPKSELAERFGVSRATINDVLQGRIWTQSK